MKKNRKSLKGMTLIEMIISLAIFAVMSLVLLTIGQVVDKSMRASTNLKEKLVQQSPLAANRVKEVVQDVTDPSGTVIATAAAALPTTPITITVRVPGSGQYFVLLDPNDPSKGVDPNAKSYNDPSIILNANKYDTKAAVKDIDISDGKPNDGLSLEFVDILPTGSPTPTSAPTT
jgi:prepilin-type N-terminal cleavage/methylation domain-containing protein